MTEKRNQEQWAASHRPNASFCLVSTGVGTTGSLLTTDIITAAGGGPVKFVRLTLSGMEGWLVRTNDPIPALPVSTTPVDVEGSQAVTSVASVFIDMKNVDRLNFRSFGTSRNYLTIECW